MRYQPARIIHLIFFSHLVKDGALVKFGEVVLKVKFAHLLCDVLRCPSVVGTPLAALSIALQRIEWLE